MALKARIRRFVYELRRRNVFKVASVYAVAAWGGTLGVAQLVPVFGAPPWVVQAFAAVAILGFPVVVVLTWVFEVTPAGVVRDAAGVPLLAASPHTTTALFGEHGVVRVVWRDVRGIEQERLFDRPFAIGREPTCAIRFDDPLVSRRHTEIGQEHGVWYVADLESRNGTWLDGVRVSRAVLPPRSVVRLSEGGTPITIELRAGLSSETRLAGS